MTGEGLYTKAIYVVIVTAVASMQHVIDPSLFRRNKSQANIRG